MKEIVILSLLYNVKIKKIYEKLYANKLNNRLIEPTT